VECSEGIREQSNNTRVYVCVYIYSRAARVFYNRFVAPVENSYSFFLYPQRFKKTKPSPASVI